MLKKIFIFIGLFLVGLGALAYWRFESKKILINPYPYEFSQSYDQKFIAEHAGEINRAENAKILIVGDRMAHSLDPYLEGLKESFGDAFKTPLTIFNWAQDNEALFRTIYKIKKLKKLPPIIIYFGASSELLEKKFAVADKEAILKNFATYDDEKLISLIITFPWLSKILYQKMNYFMIEDFKEYKNLMSAPLKLEEKELGFKFFEYELRDFIDYIKDKKSNLVLITTPLNLETEPKEVCLHANSNDIVSLQQEIDDEIKNGAYKAALPKALELAEVTTANARSYFLLGKSALGAGDLKLAREALLKATVFDCANWRGNAVYNSILKKAAEKNLLHLIDYDQYMSSKLSEEGLFFDDIFPQSLFYQGMSKELSDVLKKILSIGQEK